MKRQNNYFILWAVFFLFFAGLHLQGVVVSTAGQLATAVDNANSGGDKEIILQNGTYTLDNMLYVSTDGVTIRSQSGRRSKVTIEGQGMYGSVSHIFNVEGSNFTARDMTIGWVANHAVQIQGNENASNILLSNLRIVDTYEQMVKISYTQGSSNSSENGIMENCLLEYSAGIGPQYYIGGIDGQQCKNWIVRNNTFKNISSPSGDVAEHAVHFWSDSQGTLVDANLIIDCDRGIGFGLGSRGHSGGIIRNNMIYHSSTDHGFADVAIGLENASNAMVYNNTIFMENSYANAIEYRFPGTSGGIIKNNLCNKAITSRDGGSADVDYNITTTSANWYVDVSKGDLHLASKIPQAVDQGLDIAGLTLDFDGDSRPQGWGIDLGADEYIVPPVPSITVTSPNGGESWVAGSTHPIAWSTTGTVGNVKIEYSTDNGSFWTAIGWSASSPYSWTIPDTAAVISDFCLVRIGEADGFPSDRSNTIFSIVSSTTLNPEISLSHSQFIFGAASSGVTTNPQSFLIENSGKGTLNWSVSTNAGWLSCSPTSGTNSGIIAVSVNPSGLSAGTYTGTVNVSAQNANNSPQTIAVTLNLYAAGADSPPFGSFDTPLDGSTVRSSIPVTGWALDDVGVESVKIYRDPVPGEGTGMRYIGDAVFVSGARPDVQQGFSGYPLSDTAGWGYMMLTNFLPGGGNGTFKLYAVALDGSGNQVTLGTKTITCDNAHAVKPFGSIDAPFQGGMASGSSFINWGWVLTPQPNSIPTDGSTIDVIVDGVNVGHPTYNIYRSDIANLFSSYANSNGAIGYFSLDTTAYENGVHTIQWTARDSAGNTDGIGSRYFTILNTGGDQRSRERNTAHLFHEPISEIPVDYFEPVKITRGYMRNGTPDEIYPDENGTSNLKIQELERAVIFLNNDCNKGSSFHFAGYLVVDNQLKPLPIGSTLDTKRGIFYWLPGPGFVGNFRLAFIKKDRFGNETRINILVTILPKFSTVNEKINH
jgi:hypothetical protein